MKFCLLSAFTLLTVLETSAQENPLNNPVMTETELRVEELIQKKAEYHRLTNGVQDGYRIKIHFGIEREAADAVKTKFASKFTEIPADMEYQQPNFVILVGNFRTRLEAVESLKKIQAEFPNAFIVKGKVNLK